MLAAQHTANTVNNILEIIRGVASAQQTHTPREEAMRNVLSTISTVQHGKLAVLTAGASVADARALVAADALPISGSEISRNSGTGLPSDELGKQPKGSRDVGRKLLASHAHLIRRD